MHALHTLHWRGPYGTCIYTMAGGSLRAADLPFSLAMLKKAAGAARRCATTGWGAESEASARRRAAAAALGPGSTMAAAAAAAPRPLGVTGQFEVANNGGRGTGSAMVLSLENKCRLGCFGRAGPLCQCCASWAGGPLDGGQKDSEPRSLCHGPGRQYYSKPRYSSRSAAPFAAWPP